MLFALIAVGSFWFWSLIAVALVLGFIFIENENLAGLTWATIIAFAVICLLSPIKGTLLVLASNPLLLLGAIACYILIGLLYSFLKWDRFFSKVRMKYEQMKIEWLSNKGISGETVPQDMKVVWSAYLDRYCHRTELERRAILLAFNKVRYTDFKGLIVSWIIWWPISATWMLINDPMRKIAEELVYRFRKVYEIIANRHRSSMSNEVEEDMVAVREVRPYRQD
jgi:hypothetical protein